MGSPPLSADQNAIFIKDNRTKKGLNNLYVHTHAHAEHADTGTQMNVRSAHMWANIFLFTFCAHIAHPVYFCAMLIGYTGSITGTRVLCVASGPRCDANAHQNPACGRARTECLHKLRLVQFALN